MTERPPDTTLIRVLVVDDDGPVRDSIAKALRTYGWDATTAASGPEALEAADEDQFELMIVDLVLGDEMGGLALADLLHRKQPEACFLFISGYVDPGIPTEVLPGVPKDFLGKPLSMDRLIERSIDLLQAPGPS